MNFDDFVHRLPVGEIDVVEEAAAQKGVRQFLLVVGGDHHDGPLLGGDGLGKFVNEELHAVEFLQQVVGKLDVGLVDLVDQQHHPLVGLERLPQLALLDVVADVPDPLLAELGIAQPGDGVVFVEAVDGLGAGLDVPLDEPQAQGFGDFLRQHGLARAGLPLDEQRAFEFDRRVHGHAQLVGGNVSVGAVKNHGLSLGFSWYWGSGAKFRSSLLPSEPVLQTEYFNGACWAQSSVRRRPGPSHDHSAATTVASRQVASSSFSDCAGCPWS